MGAPEVLRLLRQSGLDVTADGGRLIVQPAERLTDDLRQLIRGNRLSILLMLGAAESDTAHHHWIVQFADGSCIEIYRHPDATGAEIMAQYPNCVDLGPLPKSDPYPDDRRTCFQCANLTGRGLCLAASAVKLSRIGTMNRSVICPGAAKRYAGRG